MLLQMLKGVIVGHKTIIDKEVCSGVTAILPNNGNLKGCHFSGRTVYFKGDR